MRLRRLFTIAAIIRVYCISTWFIYDVTIERDVALVRPARATMATILGLLLLLGLDGYYARIMVKKAHRDIISLLWGKSKLS